MRKKLPETEVVKVWRYQLLDRSGLVTEEGEPIQIIYPGRINDGQGADFRDAVIATRRGLVKGDVEVHVKSSGWRQHRHHRDAACNRVVLHVVMWPDAGKATNLQNGRKVPILALHKYIKIPVSQRSGPVSSPALKMPCFRVAQRLNTGRYGGFLDGAGKERFLDKVSRFQSELVPMGAGQSLYRGIMGALGYSKNKLPFLEVASRLPLQTLESVSRGEASEAECLARQQALLLGTAGLLPSQRPNGHRADGLDGWWIDRLERLWASIGRAEVMAPGAWHLFKVRPGNSPVRRLVAMSYLLLRCREKGLLEELVGQISKVSVGGGYRRLEKGLLVTASGYRVSYFDSGPGNRLRSMTLLGSGRAADITVNVLLPFACAWGRLNSRPELEKKAIELYHRYPRLPVNSVERHMMAQLGLSSRLVNSARRQQGLIHIYNRLCTQGRCSDCWLSQLEAGHDVQV